MKKLFLAILSAGLLANGLQFAADDSGNTELPITATELDAKLKNYQLKETPKVVQQEIAWWKHVIGLGCEFYNGSKTGIQAFKANTKSLKKHKFLATIFYGNYALSKIVPGILGNYSINFVKKAISDKQKNSSYFWKFAVATFAGAIATDKLYDWFITPNINNHVKKYLSSDEEKLAAWDKDKAGALSYATLATTLLLINKHVTGTLFNKTFNYAKSFFVPVTA